MYAPGGPSTREARGLPRTRLDSPMHSALDTGTGHRSGHSPTCQPVPTPTHICLQTIATYACNPDVNYHNVEAHLLGLELRLYPAQPCSTPPTANIDSELPVAEHWLLLRTTHATPYPVVGSVGLANPFTTATSGVSACIVSAGQDPPTLAGRSPARPCWRQATLGLRPEASPHLRTICS